MYYLSRGLIKKMKQKLLNLLKIQVATVRWGTLILNGFNAHKNHVMEDGMSSELFKKFSLVFSGHYHTRSTIEKISYLGNPYEMYWNDVGDDRGFHIFDTETRELTTINNPYRMFYNIYYKDTPYQIFDTSEYQNKIVKVIVREKTSTKDFEKFIDKLYDVGVADLKIVENFALQEAEDFEVSESEDTLSILDRYIQEAEVNLDKSRLQSIMRSTYQEACEMI